MTIMKHHQEHPSTWRVHYAGRVMTWAVSLLIGYHSDGNAKNVVQRNTWIRSSSFFFYLVLATRNLWSTGPITRSKDSLPPQCLVDPEELLHLQKLRSGSSRLRSSHKHETPCPRRYWLNSDRNLGVLPPPFPLNALGRQITSTWHEASDPSSISLFEKRSDVSRAWQNRKLESNYRTMGTSPVRVHPSFPYLNIFSRNPRTTLSTQLLALGPHLFHDEKGNDMKKGKKSNKTWEWPQVSRPAPSAICLLILV